MEDAASLEREGRELLERATTAAGLEDARVEALGRSSALTLALRELGALPAELRGARGQELNRVRGELERLHPRLREQLEASELDADLRRAAVDVTLPGDGHYGLALYGAAPGFCVQWAAVSAFDLSPGYVAEAEGPAEA